MPDNVIYLITGANRGMFFLAYTSVTYEVLASNWDQDLSVPENAAPWFRGPSINFAPEFRLYLSPAISVFIYGTLLTFAFIS